jgi:hypothetical protein
VWSKERWREGRVDGFEDRSMHYTGMAAADFRAGSIRGAAGGITR